MRDFGKVYKYKNHFITITKKKEDYYTANYTINGKEYYSGNSDIGKILKYFRSNVDKLMEKSMKEQTYEEVYKEWGGSRYGSITYKDKLLSITLVPREVLTLPFPYKSPYRKAFYVGECSYGKYNSKRKNFESIHYDKVVSKFQRFVDEYCTDWVVFSSFQYKEYRVFINKEKDKNFYIGSVQFHKNSTFKHIADTRKEVERCCKNRIDRVIYEKEKVQRKMLTPKQEKIQELEQLLARISSQLEELKKEKDTLAYKGVVLELVDDPIYKKGILRDCGTDNPAPFTADSFEHLKKIFEVYVDRLEKHYNLYRKLTGKK